MRNVSPGNAPYGRDKKYIYLVGYVKSRSLPGQFRGTIHQLPSFSLTLVWAISIYRSYLHQSTKPLFTDQKPHLQLRPTLYPTDPA